jgi:hypothetical protein
MASCMGDHIIRYFPLAESPTWSSSERSTSMLIRVMAQARPARVYEGALLFVADISCTYRDSPYKGEWGRDNDRRPSSKQAADEHVEGRQRGDARAVVAAVHQHAGDHVHRLLLALLALAGEHPG